MQRSPGTDTSTGVLPTRHAIGTSPALQRLGDTNVEQKRLGRIRRSRDAAVSGVWVVLVTALAIATLLTNCFRLSEGWRRYRNGRRRLAGGEWDSPDDPYTDAIVQLCLELESNAQGGNFAPLAPTAAATTAETTWEAAPPAVASFTPAQQTTQGGPASQPIATWSLPPQTQMQPSPYTMVVTHAPATVAAPALVTYSGPLYQRVLHRGWSPATTVTWAYGGGVRVSQPPVQQAGAAGHTAVETANPSLSASHSPPTVQENSTGQRLPQALGSSAAPSQPPPSLAPVTNPTPHASVQGSPSTEVPGGADHTADLDPGEGPSSGQRAPCAQSKPPAMLRIVTKQKGESEGSSTTSLMAESVSSQKKQNTGSLAATVPSAVDVTQLSRLLRSPPMQAPEEHRFYRLPKVAAHSLRTEFCTFLAFSNTRLLSVTYYGVLALREFLSKEAVCGREVISAIRASERLVNSLIHFHNDPVTNVRPHEAVRMLGIRYLAFDALLALTQLVGRPMRAEEWWSRLAREIPSEVQFKAHSRNIPRRSSNAFLATSLSRAIEKLKQSERPSAAETIALKRWLLCSPHSPAYFRQSRWKAWRDDDGCSSPPTGKAWVGYTESSEEEEDETE